MPCWRARGADDFKVGAGVRVSAVSGMVLTVEPGAYLRDQGMGCRIEDCVLVTEDGCEVLSKGVPALPDDIETLMAEKGVVEVPVGLSGAGR